MLTVEWLMFTLFPPILIRPSADGNSTFNTIFDSKFVRRYVREKYYKRGEVLLSHFMVTGTIFVQTGEDVLY